MKKRVTFIFNNINYYLNILPRISRIFILTNHTCFQHETSISFSLDLRIQFDQFPPLFQHPIIILFFRETVTNNRKDRIESEIKGRRRDTQTREVTSLVRWGSTLAKLQAALQMHVQFLNGFSISFVLFSLNFCGLRFLEKN